MSDTLASLLKSDPDWRALPGDLPGPIRLLIERSLVKDRRQRVGDISTALFILNEAAVLAPASSSTPPLLAARSDGSSLPPACVSSPAPRWRPSGGRRLVARRRLQWSASRWPCRPIAPSSSSGFRISRSRFRPMARSRLRQCEPRCSPRAEHSASSPFTRQSHDPRSARDVSRSPAVLFARRTIRRVFHEERGTQEDRALRRQSGDARRQNQCQPIYIRRVARFRHDRLRWAGTAGLKQVPADGGSPTTLTSIDVAQGDRTLSVVLCARGGRSGLRLGVQSAPQSAAQRDPAVGRASRDHRERQWRQYLSTGHLAFRRGDAVLVARIDETAGARRTCGGALRRRPTGRCELGRDRPAAGGVVERHARVCPGEPTPRRA